MRTWSCFWEFFITFWNFNNEVETSPEDPNGIPPEGLYGPFSFFHIGIAPEKSSWCHNKFFFQEYLLKIVLEFTKQFLIKFVHSTYIFLNFPRSSFWNNSLTLVFLLHFLQIFLVILSGIYLFYFLRIYQNIILEGLAWKTLEIPLFGNTTLISADIL